MAASHTGLDIMAEDMEASLDPIEKGINNAESHDRNPIHHVQDERYSLREVLRQRISNKHTDYLLLACCFLSGLSDTGCFNTWSCFVNMQTGSPSSRMPKLVY